MKQFSLFLGALPCLSLQSFSQDRWTWRKEINLRFGGNSALGIKAGVSFGLCQPAHKQNDRH